ncbi:unnamed protein product [Alopecurus aequalis]
MEVMSEPECDRPFTVRIDTKWTGFEMEPKPHGQPCTLRFGRCSVDFVSENHFIGGGWTRRVDRSDKLEGQELDVAHPVHGGPAALRSKSACHDAIRQMLAEVLPPLIESHAATEDDVQFWDQFVPATLVESIVDVAEDGWSYSCEVGIQVEVTRVYSEAEELLVLCEAAAVADAARRRAPGAGDACSICMEDLADGRGTVLPECSHAFHRECILQWFGKAPTCPYCRRDMITVSISDGVCT